jgi:hypothetical protein
MVSPLPDPSTPLIRMITGKLPFSRNCSCASSSAARSLGSSTGRFPCRSCVPALPIQTSVVSSFKSPHKNWIAARAARPAVSVRRIRGPRRTDKKPASCATAFPQAASPPSAPISSSTRPATGAGTLLSERPAPAPASGAGPRLGPARSQFEALRRHDFRQPVASALFAGSDDDPASARAGARHARRGAPHCAAKSPARCARRRVRRPSAPSGPFFRQPAAPAPG